MTARDRVPGFEKWFRANASRLHTLPSDVVAHAVSNELLAIDGQLGVEVQDELAEHRELILTAFADPTRFLLVHRIAAGLRAIDGWSVIALKPPRGFDFTIELDGHEVSAAALMFEPMFDTENGVRLLVDNSVTLPGEEQSVEIAWLIVETGIGEELAARIQHIEFASGSSGKSRLINTLADYVARFPDPAPEIRTQIDAR